MAITQSKAQGVPKDASKAQVERELKILGVNYEGDGSYEDMVQALNDAEKPDGWEFGQVEPHGNLVGEDSEATRKNQESAHGRDQDREQK